MAETQVATYSPTVQSALDDPLGVWWALYRYGEFQGWPPNAIAPIPCSVGGMDNWYEALNKYPALWLGQAWERIEKSQRTAVRYTGPESPSEKGPEEEMAVLMPSKSTSLEPGFYRATITEITETISEWEGKKTPQFQFQFVILDEDGDQTDGEIRGWATQKWHEKSKLYEWARAILGRKCPAPTDPFDTDKLLNKKVDIEVIPNPNRPEQTKISKLHIYESMTKERADD